MSSPSTALTKPAKPKRPTRDEKIITASATIAQDAPQGDDLAFMHSIMCQVGLPRSRVDGNEFERKSGRGILSVRAGRVFDGKELVLQPVPYGPMPRLMLAYLNTQAVRFNAPEIAVGDSAAEFMRMIGIENINGGRGGSYTTFRKQAQALAACDLTLGYIAPNGQPQTFYGRPIEHFAAWSKTESEQRALWPGVMRFSESYFRTLKEHSVPLDIRAFMALKGSALAMDIYAMFADRLHRIEGRPVVLHWANAREQFGQEYKGKDPDKDFKREFLRALKDVLAVYPKARIKQVTGGLLMMSSPPPIPYKT